MFKFVDLFAGIGGFRNALVSLGGQCVGFSEIAPDAIRTYCDNGTETEKDNLGDIRKLESLPEHDFMTAGVPCQSWSIAGRNLGFDDDRGQLWNDTLYLLNKARPKAFIFENVKGLSDPRNKAALDYIKARIELAGYHAHVYVLNAYDYGVPQARVRIYIIGFRDKEFFDKFTLPDMCQGEVRLCDVIDGMPHVEGHSGTSRFSLSASRFNDYFIFNDVRDGDTTIHSWDIVDTTDREKSVCRLLMANRRKKKYGKLDGNPLSLEHFVELDGSITQSDIDSLISKGILKTVKYMYRIERNNPTDDAEQLLLSKAVDGHLNYAELKSDRDVRKKKLNVKKMLMQMETMGIVQCVERRYDFRNSKISTGINGIYRIFLPSSNIFSTLVASDTNDYIATEQVTADTIEEYREKFIKDIFLAKKFRRITKSEACRIQGFPDTMKLPDNRARWMKLIGNSVAVKLVRKLAGAVVDTGVFD